MNSASANKIRKADSSLQLNASHLNDFYSSHDECELASDSQQMDLSPRGGAEGTANHDSIRGSPAAPDGGWGWLVLAGCFFVATFLMSIASCFGILFHDVMVSMGVSSTNVAWVLNVNLFLWNLSSSLSPPLCKHLGWRVVGCTGSITLSVAFMLMSLASSPLLIFFMFSIVIGCAGGVTIAVCLLALPVYFDMKRGMATAIFLSGIPFGQVVVPQLISGLQEQYSFHGATLIHGALLLNCCVAFALFRPLKSRIFDEMNLGVCNHRRARATDKSVLLTNTRDADGSKATNSMGQSRRLFCIGFREICSDIIWSLMDNLKGLKEGLMFLMAFSFSCFVVGYVNFLSLVPFSMVSQGYSTQDASFAVTMSGIGNILSRIVLAVVADQKWLNKKIVYICGLLITGASTFVFPDVIDKLPLLWTSLVVFGVGVGASDSMYFVLLIEVLGLDKYESAVTVTTFILAFTSVIVGPSIGLVRDITSSYSWSVGACGVVQLCAVLVWLCIVCIRRR